MASHRLLVAAVTMVLALCFPRQVLSGTAEILALTYSHVYEKKRKIVFLTCRSLEDSFMIDVNVIYYCFE